MVGSSKAKNCSGRNSFHSAIFSGRILDLTVKFTPRPAYSSRSALYWGHVISKGVGELGFLKTE